jgi:hypothetical protein
MEIVDSVWEAEQRKWGIEQAVAMQVPGRSAENVIQDADKFVRYVKGPNRDNSDS